MKLNEEIRHLTNFFCFGAMSFENLLNVNTTLISKHSLDFINHLLYNIEKIYFADTICTKGNG